MPGLAFHPEFERALTLSALAHCPRDYWWVREVREGRIPDEPASEGLAVGIAVHIGLAEWWRSRNVTRALAAIQDRTGEETGLGEVPAAWLAQAEAGVRQYAAHWADRPWEVLHVEPYIDEPLPPWLVLHGWFLSMPDLLVREAGRPGVVVRDHKTSKYTYKEAEWLMDFQLLTQALAAQQRYPNEPIWYAPDWLQKPSARSTIWSFPPTTVVPLTAQRAEAAWAALDHLCGRLEDYKRVDGNRPWPQELTGCVQKWGLCQWFERCHGAKGGSE